MDDNGVECDEDYLVARLMGLLTEETRKISFITGSGVSLGAIPGVDGIVDKMRTIPRLVQDKMLLERQLKGLSGGQKYQKAAATLKRIRGQDAVNLAIRLAVLDACTGLRQEQRTVLAEQGGRKALQAAEFDTGLWKLTPAVEHLGLLLRAMPAHRRGPVITTNFDPLLEIAVRKAGGRANVQYLDFDGRVQHTEDEDAVNIVHVHGYWREGDTLHTLDQLTAERPELTDSLRSALRDHAVVVVGYSGWEDAFSRSLLERVRAKDHLGIDLIWCSYKKLAAAVEEAPLLLELQKAPRWTFYEDIDAHRTFPKLFAGYSTAVQSPPGWTRIDRDLLDNLAAEEHTSEEIESCFDGREPGWRDALDARIPRLSVVGKLTGDMHRCLNGTIDKRVVAAVGPMGEGKSIALRQAAVDLVRRRDDITVFWREHRTPLEVRTVLSVPERPGHHILLVTDQGADFINELRQLMAACEEEGRRDIRVLLTAQSREWRSLGGFRHLAHYTKAVSSFGLEDRDCEALVQAWEGLGVLGELAKTPQDERVGALLSLSRANYGRQDSSLVGAMLQLRYGPLLREHVRNLLDRLADHPAVETTSLVQCFLMIALLHVAYNFENEKCSPLSLRVLGRVVGLEDDYLVEEAVAAPLGREAAVSEAEHGLWIRHRSIAEAALFISGERNPGELAELIRKLVTAAVELSKETSEFPDDLYAAAYLCRGLSHRDNRHLKLENEAVAAARAAVAAAPRRLSFRTALMMTLRVTGRRDQALDVGQETCRELESMSDRESDVTFIQEWGTLAGQDGKYSLNALLDAVAVHRSRDPQHIISGLLKMGLALTELHRSTGEAVFLDALRAAVGLLAGKVNPGESSRRYDKYLDNHKTYLAAEGCTPLMGTDSWAALQAAVDRLLPAAPSAMAPLLTKGSLSVLPPLELR
ncbi:P-loop NTPase [Streptomyces collinus]